MKPIKLDVEDGSLDVTIGDVTLSVDLYKVNNDLYEIGRAHLNRPVNDYQAAVAGYIASLGFPAVPHKTADDFVVAVTERVADLKKATAGGPTPGSPASTGRPS